MKTILFIRHGMTEGNRQKHYIGRTDQPLCPEGEKQAKGLAPRLPHCDMVFSSPLLRCRQTAAILFPKQDINIITDLRECDFGIFEGKSPAQLAQDPAYNEWIGTYCTSPIPGGEDVMAFKTRSCEAFLQTVSGLPENSTAAFVVHGGSIMAILEGLAQPRRKFHEFHLANCQYVICTYTHDTLTITGGSLC